MASTADLPAFEDYPLHPPPPGQISNFENPESRGPAIVILCSVFIGIMWPIFVLRLYSKVWVIRRFGWDDGKLDALPAIYLLTYWVASAIIAAVCTALSQMPMTVMLTFARQAQQHSPRA